MLSLPPHLIACLARHPTGPTSPKKPIGSSILTFNPSSTQRWVPPLWPRQKDPEFTRKLNGIKAVFGLDLEKLGTATAYGSGKKDEGVIIAKGGINSAQIEGFAGLNETFPFRKRRQVLVFFQKRRFCSLGPDSILAASNLKLLGLVSRYFPAKAGSENNPMISHLSGMVKNPIAIMTVRCPKFLPLCGWATRVRTRGGHHEKSRSRRIRHERRTSAMRMVMAMQAESEETAEHLNVLREVRACGLEAASKSIQTSMKFSPT